MQVKDKVRGADLVEGGMWMHWEDGLSLLINMLLLWITLQSALPSVYPVSLHCGCDCTLYKRLSACHDTQLASKTPTEMSWWSHFFLYWKAPERREEPEWARALHLFGEYTGNANWIKHSEQICQRKMCLEVLVKMNWTEWTRNLTLHVCYVHWMCNNSPFATLMAYS